MSENCVPNIIVPHDFPDFRITLPKYIQTVGLVSGERYVYKFVCDPEALFSMAYGQGERTSKEAEGTKSYPDVLGIYGPGGYALQPYSGAPSYLPSALLDGAKLGLFGSAALEIPGTSRPTGKDGLDGCVC